MGIGCVWFYGTLAAFFVQRRIAGKWEATCDFGCKILADNAEWKKDLDVVEPHYEGPIHTGMDVYRVRDLFGLKRSLLVLVDGHEVAALRYSSRQQFYIRPGSYKVWVQMDWCRSKSIDVDIIPDQLTTLRCGTRFRFLFPFNLSMIAVAPERCFFIEVVEGRLGD